MDCDERRKEPVMNPQSIVIFLAYPEKLYVQALTLQYV